MDNPKIVVVDNDPDILRNAPIRVRKLSYRGVIYLKSELITVGILNDLKQEMIQDGLITAEQLQTAEKEVLPRDENIGRVLIEKGFVDSKEMLKFIGNRLEIPFVNLDNYTIDKEATKLIPKTIAYSYKVIPLFKIDDVLTVAMADPVNIMSLDRIIKVAKCSIETVISSESSILAAIDQWYGAGGGEQKLVEEFAKEIKESGRGEEPHDTLDITETGFSKEAEELPVDKLVNSYIAQAMLEDASDIHLEPKRDFMVVRFRIDGFLFVRHRVPARLIDQITSRVKVMSGIDISKKRIPQDGRIGLLIKDKEMDIRTSTFPSMYGENVVLRLLDKTRGIPTLSELGFSNEDLHIFKRLCQFTKGMILATGPTGSGKTTTIYSLINAINHMDKNIMTIEDPIEYEIEGIIQSQVNPQAGVTFPNSLRSILRQDPDVIYVGEIRDRETAEVSVRAALTGHLVLSTLHTNDAIGAITRFYELGFDREAELIGSVLVCSFAQRLVRRICQRCKEQYPPDESLLKSLRLPSDTKFYKGKGCEFCNRIGYRGRIALSEILMINKDIRRLIAKKAPEDEILKAAKTQGMKTLFGDGLLKVAEGITTLEEVNRVTEEPG
jgi:type IV pilus assembly protein PilB